MMKKTKSTPNPQMPSRTLSSSASWILRGCKHPRTPSFSLDNKELDTYATHDHARGGGDEATLSDVDRFLMENFKSLYREEESRPHYQNEERPAGSVSSKELEKSGNLLESPKSSEPPKNVRRFFVGSSSSSSTSIIEESRISLTLTSGSATDDLGSCSAAAGGSSWKKIIDDADDVMGADGHIAEDFITVLKFSPNPYVDFKKSMQEMVESRLDRKGKIDWEFMQELLFCYLKLNDKKSYKFILRAFVDLVVVLRGNADRLPPKLLNLGSK